MCRGCINSALDGPIEITGQILRAAKLIESFYRLPGFEVGGPLHIHTDDYNYDHSLPTDQYIHEWMAEWWESDIADFSRDVAERAAIGVRNALALLTETERYVATGIAHGDIREVSRVGDVLYPVGAP